MPSPAPPFVALDAGNSSVKGGVWDGRWIRVERWPTDDVSAGVWAERFRTLAPRAVASGLASVVPPLSPTLLTAAETVWSAPPAIVSAASPLPFRLAYQTPQTLGADRLAAAAAGWLAEGGAGRPVVVLDAGTAVTVDVVSAEPAFLGGAILPGPDLLRRALARDTGQLPDVPFADPPSPIGTTTAECIQSGLTDLAVGGVDRLLRRTAEALGDEPALLVTGGWAPWFAERLGRGSVVPHLVLDGVRRLTAPPG